VTFTETKDELCYYYAQWYQPSDKQTCLTQQMCPCPRVTAHFVCNCHLLAFAPFSFPHSLFLLLTHIAYNTLLTTASQKPKTISQDNHRFSQYCRNPLLTLLTAPQAVGRRRFAPPDSRAQALRVVQAHPSGLLLFDTNEANAFSSNGDFFIWTFATSLLKS